MASDSGGPRGLSLLFTTFCIVDLFGVFPIIALPRPVIDCGWIGLPLAFSVFILQIYTAMLLGKCWTIAEHLDPDIVHKSRYPYTALAEMTIGQNVGKLVTLLLDVTVLTAGVPNLMVAAQNLQILGIKIAEGHFEISFCYWLFILGVILCPIMWLGSPKDMKWLAVLSVFTVMLVSVLTWLCMFTDDVSDTSGTIPRPTWESTAIAYGIMAFQFDIHPTILSVQMDMERKSQLGLPIVGAFLVTGTLFGVTTMFAMLKYGTGIQLNVLQGLPASGALYVDLTLVTAQIFLSMVIGTSALFQDVEDKLRIPREFNLRRCVLRSSFVLVMIFLGYSVPRFDLIMGLIGGALTGPLMFILPPILYSKLRTLLHAHKLSSSLERAAHPRDSILYTFRDYDTFGQSFQFEKEKLLNYSIHREDMSPLLEQERTDPVSKVRCKLEELTSFDECLKGDILSTADQAICYSIIFLGVAATFAATFYTMKNTVLYAEFTPSCVMNFTAASILLEQQIA